LLFAFWVTPENEFCEASPSLLQLF
jgi:hypothetical protein